MQLIPKKLYTSNLPDNVPNYKNYSLPPCMPIIGGSIDVYFSNGALDVNDPNYDPNNIYNLQPDDGNPYLAGESPEFSVKFNYMLFLIHAGTPSVTVTDGIWKQVIR